MIYTLKRRYKSHAFIFAQNGPARALQFLYRFISIDGYDKYISQLTRTFEVSNMPDGQAVKAAVGQQDLPDFEEFRQTFECNELHKIVVRNCEIGRILDLKSEIRNWTNKPDLIRTVFVVQFRISDLRSRIRPISQFPLG